MYFFIYSFLGWCAEVAYCAMNTGKIVNRGFLNGPVCPIYGFGMTGIIIALYKVKSNMFLVFVGGMAITTAIEFIGGWILYKRYKTRWWDYSNCPFNIGGFVCLKFSILWGLSTTAVMSLVQPVIKEFVDKLVFGWIFVAAFSALMIADLIVSEYYAKGLNVNIKELEKLHDGLRERSDALSEKIGSTALDTEELLDIEKVNIELFKEEKQEELLEWKHDWYDKTSKLVLRHRNLETELGRHSLYGKGRLLMAFPDIYSEKKHISTVLDRIKKTKNK